MTVLSSSNARRAMLTTVGALALACASPQTPVPANSVPRTAGTVASSTACRVSGAWNMSGVSVPAPSVARCVLPRYPSSMRAGDQQGEIVFRVAVDSAGRPDSSSLRVVRTSTRALVAALQAAAPYLRFEPAASRPVIVVEMPYTFTLEQ